MQITPNFSKPQEINVNQPKRIKKRPNDDYDYNDPIFEQSEEDLELVKIEPSITDFYVYDPKVIKKDFDLSLESQIASQNQIFKKIIEGKNTSQDLFRFLILDLIINNDLQFTRCLKKISELVNHNIEVENFNLNFLKNQFESFKTFFLEFEASFCQTINCLPLNTANEVEFDSELLVLVYEYMELSAILKCYLRMAEQNKKFFYRQFKKSIYAEIGKMFVNQPSNIKKLGKLVSAEVKRIRKGKVEEYLTLNE